MIDKEVIRQSIAQKSFSQNKKESGEELQEWKFTFSTVIRCRIWYSALIKLKQHFIKQNDHMQDFLNNFDPEKRNSIISTKTTSPKSSSIIV